MRKIIVILGLLFVTGFTLWSCSDNESLSEGTNVNDPKLMRGELTIEDFEIDPRLQQMDSIGKILAPLSLIDDEAEYVTQYNKLHTIAYEVVADYGYGNAKDFSIELATTTTVASGDCCSLTEDGTTDWSCCGFWESVSVYFQSVGCTQPTSLDPEQNLKQVNAYYDCVQSIICETC